ncbi:hypothetical protein [Streptomyces sp. NPDC046985]|uniref:hypothetical protein n=1 Tax=Streptomyces sp. NPDC046985 TaxID=3155377 RepID=UPI003407FA46
MRRSAATIGGFVLALGMTAAGSAVAATQRADTSATASVSAQSCEPTKEIHVHHNAAGLRYVECHRTSGGRRQSSVALWLWDNKTDGKCASGYVAIGDQWGHSWAWCSTREHSPKLISGWHNGSDAHVYLTLT